MGLSLFLFLSLSPSSRGSARRILRVIRKVFSWMVYSFESRTDFEELWLSECRLNLLVPIGLVLVLLYVVSLDTFKRIKEIL